VRLTPGLMQPKSSSGAPDPRLPMLTSYLKSRDDFFWTTTLIVLVMMWIPVFCFSIRGSLVDSWAYSDLLINWSAGFVRRGLYGTLAIAFHSITGGGVVLLTSIIFMLLTLLQIGILFYLLRQFKQNYMLLVLVGLSPAMMLFAVYDTNAYWRKESFLNAAIFVHALIARKYLTRTVSLLLYQRLFICVIIPVLIINTLVYEVQALFVPFHIALTLSIYGVGEPQRSQGGAKRLFIVGYLAVFIPFIASVLEHGDEQKSEIMFNSIKSWSGALAKQAIDAHAWTFTASYITARRIITDPLSVLTYLWAFLLGPVMLVIAIRRQCNSRYDRGIHVWPFIPPLALFFIGWDWGRWINMIAIHGVAYMLHIPCQPNSGISTSKSVDLSHQRVLCFMLISFVTFYTMGWSLPHCCLHPNLFGGRTFFTVWLQIYDDIQRVFERL
jgi:hypothetical protein